MTYAGLGELPDEMEDPLLDLIRNHEAFSEETFLEALRSQRPRRNRGTSHLEIREQFDGRLIPLTPRLPLVQQLEQVFRTQSSGMRPFAISLAVKQLAIGI